MQSKEVLAMLVQSERPNFGPTQVLTPEELVPGKPYIRHYRGTKDRKLSSPGSTKFEVIEPPSSEGGQSHQDMRVKVRLLLGYGKDYETSLLLSDMGLIPHARGWDRYNWTEDPERNINPPQA